MPLMKNNREVPKTRPVPNSDFVPEIVERDWRGREVGRRIQPRDLNDTAYSRLLNANSEMFNNSDAIDEVEKYKIKQKLEKEQSEAKEKESEGEEPSGLFSSESIGGLILICGAIVGVWIFFHFVIELFILNHLLHLYIVW